MEAFLGKNFATQVKDKVYSDMFRKTHSKRENIFTRRRKLTFSIVFSSILNLVKRSLGIECELMEPLASKIPPSKQAFSKARYKFAHTGFKELLQDSIRMLMKMILLMEHGTHTGLLP